MWNMLDLEKATLTQVKLVSPLDRRMLSYFAWQHLKTEPLLSQLNNVYITMT